jgi:hypothetical protein
MAEVREGVKQAARKWTGEHRTTGTNPAKEQSK